ncbi:MAG: hypothetical protein HZA04_10000 [Nitrospinae bacterium]|nr:hypothetical protein [Nitrospinota bacterium]
MNKKLLTTAVVALMAASCISLPSSAPKNVTTAEKEDRFGTRFMASEINQNLRPQHPEGLPIIVSTFVDLNDLAKTSVFGRMIAEKLIDDLSRQGFHVIEVRRAQDLLIKKDVGELILTREAAEMVDGANARAVLAGTYVATQKSVIINARLIDVRSPQVLSTVSFEVAMTEEIENLIKGTSPF